MEEERVTSTHYSYLVVFGVQKVTDFRKTDFLLRVLAFILKDHVHNDASGFLPYLCKFDFDLI